MVDNIEVTWEMFKMLCIIRKHLKVCAAEESVVAAVADEEDNKNDDDDDNLHLAIWNCDLMDFRHKKC